MSEWKKVKLGEITQIIDGDRGKNYPKDRDFLNNGYCLFLNTGNVTQNGFTFESNQFISKDKDEQLRKGKLLRGDLVYTTRGTVGNVAYYGDTIPFNHIRINSGMVILRVGHNVNPIFIYQLLKSKTYRTYFKSFCTGSAQPQLPIKNLSQILIDVPDVITQNHIATILSRYDSLIENYQKQIKLLEEAAQRLYKEWFVDLHFPGHENTKIVDGVPEGWEKKTINDICTHISSGSTPSRRNKSYWENGTIKWVKTKELLDGWIFDTEEYITDDGLKNSSTKIYPVNSILMAIYASPTLGRLGILASECCCNQAALCLIANDQIVSWQWLYWKLFELRDEFNSIARGAGQQNISGIVVKNKEVLVPTKQVVDAFTNIANPIFESIKKISSQIRLLTEARDRLLPKLMSGEIAV